MDEDVEVIIPDSLDAPGMREIFTDFSQVQIQVHEPDEAGKIIEDPGDIQNTNTHFGTAELDDDVEIISDDYPPIKGEPENHIDFVDNTTTQDVSIRDCTNILEEIDITESNLHEDVDMTVSDNDQEIHYGIHEKIPDKDISKYDALIEEYPDFTNVSIKEEIEPFIGTDFTDFDHLVEEHNSDDLPPEDIYHCNNVIILGTKPCKSSSILRGLLNQTDSTENTEIRKEHLNAVVQLEDWGVHLEKSNGFCKDCGTLFATSNDFDAHKMIAHSFLVPVNRNVATKSTTKPASARKSTGAMVKNNNNIARKSTGSKEMGSTFCNHCSKMFPDNTTLIKHLYELLTLKQFTCNICNAVFKKQEELTNHNTVHVKTEKVKIKKEKADEMVADTKKNKYAIAVQKKPVESEAIPKSVLFQCPKCAVHFVTPKNGYHHYLVCSESVTTLINTNGKPQNCDTCKRTIHYKDFDIHSKQHKLSTKFRVFKVSKSLCEKVLCKCPDCELYFSDYGINLHLNNCGKLQSWYCQRCNIWLPKHRNYIHMKMHKHRNLKPKDFVQIQYSIQRSAVKRKTESPIKPTKKIKLEYTQENEKSLQKVAKVAKIKKEPQKEALEKISLRKATISKNGQDFRMFFCKNCKGCCYLHRHRVIHLKNQCVSRSYVKTRVICPKCGLQFGSTSMKHHSSLHQRGIDFSIHKVAFYDLHSAESTVPSIPDYPQCKNCKIKFFSAKVKGEHICGEDYETCGVCGDFYHYSAYSAHIEFHKLIEKCPKPNKKTTLMPELIKKYKSLNMMWNIVYCCKKCDIVTDQYDKAVEHSQHHLNNETTKKNIKCYICNLKFDETCWSKHSELHSQMTINSKDFKILNYNPRKLLTREWFELFQSLPKELIKQVTDKSVYSHERRFKLKVLKEGRPEFTVYCCSDCKVVCRNNEIELHINSICRKSTNICQTCSMPFSDISTLRNHQIMHMKGIKKEEFRVVIFTKQKIRNKTQKNIKPKQQSQKPKSKQPKLLTKVTKNKTNKLRKQPKSCTALAKDSNGKYILHRCRVCRCCIHFKSNIRAHKCQPSFKTRNCPHCKEVIIARHMDNHKLRHLHQPGFNVNNIIFKFFDPSNKTFMKDEFKQVKKKPKNSNKFKNRSKINKVNATDSSANKTVKTTKEAIAGSSTKPTQSNASTAAKAAIVYKCECGLHYTSLKNIEKHTQTCDSETEISKENCSKCGLLFPTDVLVSHLCKHHCKNSQFIVESYQKEYNVESTSESPIPTKKPRLHNCQVKLYKCRDCDIYFVNQNTCYKHALNHRAIDKRQYIKCKLCGFQFTIKSLPIHVGRHHSTQLNLENVLIEEYRPRGGKGPLKSDLYVAADKVQSFQVTSSMEE